MTKVVVSDAAHKDLLAILGEIGVAAGEKVAVFYAAEVERFYSRLALFPESGSPRRALGVNARIGILYPYVVVYDYLESEKTVIVLCLVHGRRRITKRLVRGFP
jgi:toxin ParE1/3/4